MIRFHLLLLVLPVVFLAGCSSTAPAPDANNVDGQGNTVSGVPWNKPESWETGGQLGGLGVGGH